LETISKDFLYAYKWLIFSKQSNIEWCIENTTQIINEAIYLRKLYFKQTRSEIGRRLARKCNKWHAYYKAYGIESKRTSKQFRGLIHGIADTDIDNYSLLENFLFNDDVYWKHIENYSKSKEEKCVRSLHCPMPRTTLLRVRPTVLTTMVSTNRPTLDTSMSVSRYSNCDTLDIHDEQEKEDLQENHDKQCEESDDKQCEKSGKLENDKHENYTSVNMDTDKKCPAMCVMQTDTGVDVSLKIVTVVPGGVDIPRAEAVDGEKKKNILPYNVVERKYQSLKIEDNFALRKDVLVVQEGVHVYHGPVVQCGAGVWAQQVAYWCHQLWDPGGIVCW